MKINTTRRTVELNLSSEDMSRLLDHKDVHPELTIDGRELVMFFPLKGGDDETRRL